MTNDTPPFAAFERMLALRYLRSRRKDGFVNIISVLSFLGVLLGVATLVAVLAVFNGFRQELLDKVLGFAGHATVYRDNLEPMTDFEQVREKIKVIPGVARVTPLLEGQAMVSSAKTSTGALVRGLSEADIKLLSSINNKDLKTAIQVPGTPDAEASLDGFDKSQGVIIGERMSWRHRLNLGSTLTLISPNGAESVLGNTPTIRDYTVVGIFKMGMADLDDGLLYLPFVEAQDFLSVAEGVSGLEVVLDDAERVNDIRPALLAAVGGSANLQTWQERNKTFFAALVIQRNVVMFVVSLIALVAALNIVSGLVMLVKEKSSNIAILRTMGASSGSMMRIFFMTGAAIGVLGTLFGLIIGLLLAWNIDLVRAAIEGITGVDPFVEEIYIVSKLRAIVDPFQTATVVLMALLLSFLATIYPAWKAAKLDPVEALRYE
jgi:lipoprotein-releasing system permease protein